jgi:uncharacterized hydrophobic protein (TIGR00271 family)
VDDSKGGDRYHIIAAVGARAEQETLLALARALAGDRGAITLLYVTPDGERPAWLLPAVDGAPPVDVQVLAGDDPGDAIVALVADVEPDILLLGWTGEEGSRHHLLGRTLDQVIRYASCHVVVARADRWPDVRRALVPAAGGPNAGTAIDLALHLSPDIEVTALYVARQLTGPLGVAAGHEQLTRILEPWDGDARVRPTVVRAPSVIDGILDAAHDGQDVLLVGASNESYVDRKLFGDVPQALAVRAKVPTLIVRPRAGPIKSILRRAERVLADVQDRITVAERVEAYREIRRGARPRLDFFVMIGLASAIASLGLAINSAAVIIGAMIIAPLMSAIFGVSMGVVQGDVRLLWRAGGTTLRGAALAIGVGLLVGTIVPLPAPTSEMLSRSQPTLVDLVIALLSGTAGAYAQCRRSTLEAVAGVAVAVALVPPLAITGLGLTLGSGAIAGGALLLFLTNLCAITAAGSLIFLLFGFRPDPGRRVRVFSRGMIGVLVALVLVSVLLTVLTIDSIREGRLHRAVEAALVAEVSDMGDVSLVDWQTGEPSTGDLRLSVEVQSTHPISHQDAIDLQDRVAQRIHRPVHLVLSVATYARLDPQMTPTPGPAAGSP